MFCLGWLDPLEQFVVFSSYYFRRVGWKQNCDGGVLLFQRDSPRMPSRVDVNSSFWKAFISQVNHLIVFLHYFPRLFPNPCRSRRKKKEKTVTWVTLKLLLLYHSLLHFLTSVICTGKAHPIRHFFLLKEKSFWKRACVIFACASSIYKGSLWLVPSLPSQDQAVKVRLTSPWKSFVAAKNYCKEEIEKKVSKQNACPT